MTRSLDLIEYVIFIVYLAKGNTIWVHRERTMDTVPVMRIPARNFDLYFGLLG